MVDCCLPCLDCFCLWLFIIPCACGWKQHFAVSCPSCCLSRGLCCRIWLIAALDCLLRVFTSFVCETIVSCCLGELARGDHLILYWVSFLCNVNRKFGGVFCSSRIWGPIRGNQSNGQPDSQSFETVVFPHPVLYVQVSRKTEKRAILARPAGYRKGGEVQVLNRYSFACSGTPLSFSQRICC